MAAALLTTDNFREVKKAVYDARARWRALGEALGLKVSDLDAIHGSDAECLSAMLTIWLKQRSKTPTWAKLVEALKEPDVEGEEVAAAIVQNYRGMMPEATRSGLLCCVSRTCTE